MIFNNTNHFINKTYELVSEQLSVRQKKNKFFLSNNFADEGVREKFEVHV